MLFFAKTIFFISLLATRLFIEGHEHYHDNDNDNEREQQQTVKRRKLNPLKSMRRSQHPIAPNSFYTLLKKFEISNFQGPASSYSLSCNQTESSITDFKKEKISTQKNQNDVDAQVEVSYNDDIRVTYPSFGVRHHFSLGKYSRSQIKMIFFKNDESITIVINPKMIPLPRQSNFKIIRD